MTEPGGPAWRQTTFFPFSITSRLAAGEVIRPVIEAPAYDTARHGERHPSSTPSRRSMTGGPPCSSSTATLGRPRRSRSTCAACGCTRITEAVTLADAYVYAKNTLARPERVTPAANASAALADGVLTIELPPVSWTAAAMSGAVLPAPRSG